MHARTTNSRVCAHSARSRAVPKIRRPSCTPAARAHQAHSCSGRRSVVGVGARSQLTACDVSWIGSLLCACAQAQLAGMAAASCSIERPLLPRTTRTDDG